MMTDPQIGDADDTPSRAERITAAAEGAGR